MSTARALWLLQRGYSDGRIAELTELNIRTVASLRSATFPERIAPRSRGPEQGAERLDGRETYATQTLSGG